jgi:mRNA interferase RelE/StbE
MMEGDCRVVFRVEGEEILALGICHSKDVCPVAEKRN